MVGPEATPPGPEPEPSMSKRPQDHWGHKARKEGYAARSVYKLEEIDRRTHILKVGTRPSKKSIARMVKSITEETDRNRTLLDASDVVGRLNRKLIGWANYFCLGPVTPAYRAINTHAIRRLRRWLCKKHKVRGTGITRNPDQYLYEQLGLINLSKRTLNLPWAKA
jgi:hypothetical protein